MKFIIYIASAAALVAVTILSGCGGSDANSTSLTSPQTNGIGTIAARFVYVVNSGSNDVSAYGIDAQTGALTSIGNSPFSAGVQPSAITIATSGKYAYVSNSGSNDISGYSIAPSTGALTPLAGSPYAVSPFTAPVSSSISPVAIDPSGKLAFVANPSAPEDTLTHLQPNNLSVYTIDVSSGRLQPAPGSPMTTGGLSPDAISVDPSGKFVYVANQIPQAGSEGNSISAFSLDTSNGSVTTISGSPFVAPSQRGGPVSMTIDPDGAFLYVACQAQCSIAGYNINSTTGGLTSIDVGSSLSGGLPQSNAFINKNGNLYAYAVVSASVCAEQVNTTTGTLTQVNCSSLPAGSSSNALAVDPSGSFVFVTNPASNNVSVFSIDATTGALSSVRDSPFPAGSSPSALAIDKKGSVLYVTNRESNDISAYAINRANGALGTIPGSPFGAGIGASAIVLL